MMFHALLVAAVVTYPTSTDRVPAAPSDVPSLIARKLVYRPESVPIIYVQLGWVTQIELPKSETVMTGADHPMHNGDVTFFEVTANANFIYIKPWDVPVSGAPKLDAQRGGRRTDIAVDTAAGNHFVFLIQETTKSSTPADLKVQVIEADKDQIANAQGSPKFVSASEVEALRAQLAEQQEQLRKATELNGRTKAVAAEQEAGTISHDYHISGHKGKEKLEPIVFRDDKFTYVQIESQEVPSFWELKDGQLLKVDAVYLDGKYRIQHIVDKGELRIGRSSVTFAREG